MPSNTPLLTPFRADSVREWIRFSGAGALRAWPAPRLERPPPPRPVPTGSANSNEPPAAGEGFLERIRHHVRELAFPVPAERTQVRYAQLGADAGFIGAACGRQLVRPR
jgi:hypothetical protein